MQAQTQKLGRYTLLGKLAAGGMAELFLARQSGPQGFSKTVVIKRILQQYGRDDHFVQMFLNEARLAALLNHPNIVSIYELIEDAERAEFSIVMEFIDGRNLKSIVHSAIRTHGSFPVHLACRIVADAAGALHYAHEKTGEDGKPLKLIHRDISPENILVTYSGQAKVVDFGIAKAAAREGLTATGQVKGKFAYMAPEQIRGGGIDRRADVWALGVTLYWMLTGVKPFRAENELELVQKITQSEPPPLSELRPDVPPAVASAIMRTLIKDASQRTASAGELQEDLEGWLATSGTVATSLTLANYFSKLFPAETDPDRRLTARLLSGAVESSESMTPTDLPMVTRAKHSTDVSMVQRFPGNRLPWLVAGSAVGVVILLVIGIAIARHPSTTDSGPTAATTPLPIPTPSPPPPAPNPQPLPTAVARSPTTPLPSPPEPRPAPERRVASSELKPKHPKRSERPAAPAPAAPQPSPVSKGPPGTLSFRVLPWADVYVDGTHVGTTPFEPVEVPAGRHEVRLVNDRLEAEKKITVMVKSGTETPVNARLP